MKDHRKKSIYKLYDLILAGQLTKAELYSFVTAIYDKDLFPIQVPVTPDPHNYDEQPDPIEVKGFVGQ